jgi:hypothetical protein
MTKPHLGSLENYAHYFPKGYGRPRGVDYVPGPHANEAVVFEDFFTAGLRMPPLLILVDILHKFQVQLCQLTQNVIVQISKFIWTATSYGGHSSMDFLLSSMSYTIRIRKFILRDLKLPSLANLVHISSYSLWKSSKNYTCCKEQVDRRLVLVFFAPARYRVVKIVCSCSEVVL